MPEPKNKKKYVINVDFLTTSKVHLNPEYFGGMWCKLNEKKKREFGGRVYVNTEEARKYLKGEVILIFDKKPVTNLEQCLKCSKLNRQKVYWDL